LINLKLPIRFMVLQISEDIFAKATGYDKSMSENIELGLELKTVMLERDKFKLEVDRVSLVLKIHFKHLITRFPQNKKTFFCL